MKINTLFAFAAAGLMMTACGESPETVVTTDPVDVTPVEETETSAAWAVDADASTLNWEGEKLGLYAHTGTVAISEGSINTENGMIVGGEFTIDMTTLQSTDITDAEEAANLIGHLSSQDFFHVDSFATSTFVITGCEAAMGDTVNVMGNLTLMGQTKNITIPTIVSVDGDNMSATSSFAIDRTQWGVVYGSGVELAVDQVISDEIKYDLSLVAKKN